MQRLFIIASNIVAGNLALLLAGTIASAQSMEDVEIGDEQWGQGFITPGQWVGLIHRAWPGAATLALTSTDRKRLLNRISAHS